MKARSCLVALVLLVASRAASAGDMRIEIDKSERELRVYEGGARVATHPVAVGTPKHPTPTGSYTIDRIDWNPDWTPPNSDWTKGQSYKGPGQKGNPMGRVRMVFKAPYTVHGTDALGSLGKAASHGSIRLANAVIIALAPRVMRDGGAPRSDGWVQETLAQPGVMRSVTLPDPVPILIQE